MTSNRLRYAMVGGGRDAFIGAVHRHAMALDHRYELVAGALSSSPEKAPLSGRDPGLPEQSRHRWGRGLLDNELSAPPHERIELAVIVTPNHVHHEVAA